MGLEELLSRMALAFGIGLLIGLERGWHTREAPPGTRAAGVRTFALSGLLGGLVGALAARDPGEMLGIAGGALLGAAFLTYGLTMIVFGRDENKAAGRFSATTTVAALTTFMLGAYSILGDVHIAAASAVLAAGVLMFREGLHGWVAKLTRKEFESGLGLLAMTFIALPIVPNRSVGPLGGLNLREVWLIAIVLAAVSFAGYVAVKLLGERRGILVSAIAGGVVSSTAVALANARRAAAGEASPHSLAAGTALAMAVSFVRVALIVSALKPSLLLSVAPALAAAAVVATAFSIASLRHVPLSAGQQPAAAFRNPFAFWSVLGLAASMGALIVLGRYINEKFGATGAIAGAAAMGLFDVDAMTVAMTRLVPDSLESDGAAIAIMVGVSSNTFSKLAIAAAIGSRAFAIRIAAVGLACLVAGACVLWLRLMMR